MPHFGRNSWPSAAAKMPLGPSYQPIGSQSLILNRPLCCEHPNVRVKVHGPCKGGTGKTQLWPRKLPMPL